MKNFVIVLCTLLIAGINFAQTTAMDFNRNDCNGVPRHLFGDLDAGKAVIIEFFMINCSPCPAAAAKLEAMKTNLLSQYPGKINSYAIAFNNIYTPATVNNWVNSGGFSAIPMDSGATQVAYYGGMGMPTIVILGGVSTHSVLGAPYIGFSTSDTTQMAANIRTYLNSMNTTAITEQKLMAGKVSVFPNPVNSEVSVKLFLESSSQLEISLYDVSGRLIKSLEKTAVPQGEFSASYDLSELANGNYLLKIKSNEGVLNKKISITH